MTTYEILQRDYNALKDCVASAEKKWRAEASKCLEGLDGLHPEFRRAWLDEAKRIKEICDDFTNVDKSIL